MKLKGVIVVLILAVFLLFAAVTKPDKEHFQNWIKNKYNEERAENENILDKGVKEIGKIQASANVTYQDKLIFAIVKTKAFGEEVKYVGLLGSWIKSSSSSD